MFILEESKFGKEEWQKEIQSQIHYPVYFSIDKDVFRKEEVSTDWDQGNQNSISLMSSP